MSKEIKAELVGVIVKIDGKEVTISSKDARFRGWEAECDLCGSHGGCDLEFTYEKNSYDIELHSF